MQRQDTHSKLIGYLLWIFGFTGAHRFYYGKPVTGTIWFFTFGLFFVGWIIDFFLIPAARGTVLLEALVEKRLVKDSYTDQEVEPSSFVEAEAPDAAAPAPDAAAPEAGAEAPEPGDDKAQLEP